MSRLSNGLVSCAALLKSTNTEILKGPISKLLATLILMTQSELLGLPLIRHQELRELQPLGSLSVG